MDNRVEIVAYRIKSQNTVYSRGYATNLVGELDVINPYITVEQFQTMLNEFYNAGSTVYVDKALGMVFRLHNLTFVPSCPHTA